MTATISRGEMTRLANGSTKYGYFRPPNEPIYVMCPLKCGDRVESVLDRYSIPMEKRLRMTDRGWESAELKALRARVREHLGEDCPEAGTR